MPTRSSCLPTTILITSDPPKASSTRGVVELAEVMPLATRPAADPLGLSIGFVIYPETAGPLETLIHKTDEAMFVSRRPPPRGVLRSRCGGGYNRPRKSGSYLPGETKEKARCTIRTHA